MRIRWLEVALFVVGLVALFVWAGEVVSGASGATNAGLLGEGVSLENGEAIFWGPGKCHTCHAVGPRGRSVRGPNLGESAAGADLAIRAADRARERSAALGRPVSLSDYLVESLGDPSVYLVPGYKDEMPVVYDPPISLGPDEFASVVLYLQSIGGSPDPGAITLPPEVFLRERTPEVVPWAPYLDGDSLAGRRLFFDPEGRAACSKCHRVNDEGGSIGPELTHVAGTRTMRSVVESILEPSRSIARGYETVLIETNDGRILDGVVLRETSDSVWLATSTAEEFAIGQAGIARRRTQETSLMPGDIAEGLSVRELHDLLAYLWTLQ